MLTDIFRGKQPIAILSFGEGWFVTLAEPDAGLVAFSSVLAIGDRFVGLIEINNRTEWMLAECELNGIAPDTFYVSSIMESAGFNDATFASGTLSSVARSASYLPDIAGNIQFNGARLQGYWLGATNVNASDSNNVGVWADTTKLFNIYLNANLVMFSVMPPNGYTSGMGITVAGVFRQDATGGRTVALPSNFYPTTGSTLNLGANEVTLATFLNTDGGENWYYSFS